MVATASIALIDNFGASCGKLPYGSLRHSFTSEYKLRKLTSGMKNRNLEGDNKR